MDENKIMNEEDVVVEAEELNEDAVAEETGAAEETEAAEEGFAEKVGSAVDELVREADEAALNFATEAKTAVDDIVEEADEEVEVLTEEAKATAEDIVAKVKALVKDGNVTYIRIRKDDKVVLNLPVTVGIIGTVIGLAAAPWVVVLATITTIGLKCTVEVEKKDGSVVTIHGQGKKEE